MTATAEDGEDGAGRRKMFLLLDPDLIVGLKDWAEAEDRSASAQARVVLREAIPAKFLSHDGEA